MAFLSDIYLPVERQTTKSSKTAHRRVNWRLLLALTVNIAVWTSLIQLFRALI